MMIKAATGAVIDATLIESSARPNRIITVETDEDWQGITFDDGSNPSISCTGETSVDEDAAWVKKGKKSHCGYRPCLTVEETEGYVCGVHTAPATKVKRLISFQLDIIPALLALRFYSTINLTVDAMESD